jgi:uncharacterized protein
VTTAQIIKALKAHARFPSRIHGPAHWARVHRFGVLLAEREQLPAAGRVCVEVFAWVHDLAREDDSGSNHHAIEGAASLDRVLPAIFDGLSSEQVETIRAAIRYHSDGMTAGRAYDAGAFDDLAWPRELVVPTIGCCWDADRLDLPRVGVHPGAQFMSTSAWREVLPLSEQVHRSVGEDTLFAPPTSYDPAIGARRQKIAHLAQETAAPAIIEITPRSRDD